MAKKFKNLNSAFFLSLKFKKINSVFLLSIFIFIFSVFIISSTEIVFAQTQEAETLYFTPQIEIPFSAISGETAVGTADQDGKVTSDLLARYLSAIYDYGMMIGGILAAIMIMAGGILWLTSGGDSGQVGKAKTIITGSISGLVILFGAYFILNTINPDLVKMKGIEMIVAQNVNYLSCCHTELGEKNIYVYEKDGIIYYSSREKAGQVFAGCEAEFPGSKQCADGSRCEEKTLRVSNGGTPYGGPVYTNIKQYSCSQLAEEQVGQEFSLTTCCHPENGKIEIEYQEIDGIKYYYENSTTTTKIFSGCESLGAVQCANDYNCANSSQAYDWYEYRCYNESVTKLCCHCEEKKTWSNNKAFACSNGLTISECKAYCESQGLVENIEKDRILYYYRFPEDLASCVDNKCKLNE